MFQISSKGQSAFHQTPLNDDEDELVNRSGNAPSCTPALKPSFCFSDDFPQTPLIGEEVRQETSQPPCHLFSTFPLKCQLNFDIHIKRGFLDTVSPPGPTSRVRDESEICGTIFFVAQGNRYSCNVVYWPSEGIMSTDERRHGTSQLRLYMTGRQVVSPVEPVSN